MTSSPRSPEFLQAARRRTDPLADQFVAELAHTKSGRELYLTMRFLLNEYVWVDHEMMEEPAKKYIAEAAQLPEWADEKLLRKGEDFFSLHAFEITTILFMKSLPATYCCAKGAEVVHATGRLTDNSGNMVPFTRRLMMTGKFVLNVMSPHGFDHSGYGFKSAVKVRTLHAFVRYFLKSENWDIEKFDEPINQEDYAGTMLAFSVFVVEGLEQLGVKVSKDDKEAYFHVWRVVAHVIGVEADLIEDNYDDAQALGHQILNEQKAPSQAGETLTKASLEFCQSMVPLRVMNFLPQNMMYFFLGPELSAMVGIKKSKNLFARILFYLFRQGIKLYEWMKVRFKFVRRFALRHNTKILDTINRKILEETKNQFTPNLIAQDVKEMKEHPHD